MPTTEYKNHLFELKITSINAVVLLPRERADVSATHMLDTIYKFHTECNILKCKIWEIAGPIVGFECTHTGGEYKDQEEFVAPPPKCSLISWPDAVTDGYSILCLARLMELRNELAKSLAAFHPSLIEFEFH